MKPLPPDRWSKELSEIKEFLGVPLNIHNIMAHHPKLLKAWSPLRNHVVGASNLSPGHRELLILRTAFNCEADYEWQHHVERGLTAGLKKVEIDRVKQGPDASDWQADESALLSAADDCFSNFCISDKNVQEVSSHFNKQQQLDLVVTVGMYITLAFIIKTWDVPMEDR